MSPAPHPVDAAPLAPDPTAAETRPSCPARKPRPLAHLPELFRSRASDTTRLPPCTSRATPLAVTAHRAPDSPPPSRNPAAASPLGPAPARPPHGSAPHPPLSANSRAPPPIYRGACTTHLQNNSRQE